MSAYDIYEYGRMVRDEVRMGSYVEALRQSVTADSVVLDIGTGAGIFALLACRFGARRVFAVEPNDVIHIARDVAKANGYADRIEFIQDLSTNITLPERADLLVTDMRGLLPTFEHNLPSIIDARQRLLKPSATMIPKSDPLWAVPIEAEESYDFARLPWASHAFEFNWEPAKQVALNEWFKARGKLTPLNFLADPQCWATIDYEAIESPNVVGDATWTARREGVAHGLAVWFDSWLTADVGFSNAPGKPATVFGQAFFPWPEPVSVGPGDIISTEFKGDLVGNRYLWRWKTSIWEGSDKTTTKAAFRQSNFFALPLSSSSSSSHETR